MATAFETPFTIGQAMWMAIGDAEQVTKPCPVCNGDKAVTIILGTGEHVSVLCDTDQLARRAGVHGRRDEAQTQTDRGRGRSSRGESHDMTTRAYSFAFSLLRAWVNGGQA
jgi:hypothetical protein